MMIKMMMTDIFGNGNDWCWLSLMTCVINDDVDDLWCNCYDGEWKMSDI